MPADHSQNATQNSDENRGHSLHALHGDDDAAAGDDDDAGGDERALNVEETKAQGLKETRAEWTHMFANEVPFSLVCHCQEILFMFWRHVHTLLHLKGKKIQSEENRACVRESE